MKTMRIDINKTTSVKTLFAFIVAASVTLLACGALNQAGAQRLGRRPRANGWAPQASKSPQANSAFGAARDLIDDAQWAKAETAFNQYVSQYPKEENLDAAMYWMAYAEYQLKSYNKCKTTVDKLLKTYEKTPWRQDAELLLAQLPGVVAPKAVTVGATAAVETVTAEAIAATVNQALANADTVVEQSLSQTPAVSPEAQERLVEAQERMIEAQERARERTKEAQERMMERVKDAQEKMKDKTLFKVGVSDGMGYGVGFGREKLADDDPCEFKIVVLQALVDSDPQRGVAAATDWLKPNSGLGPPCRRYALRVLARHGGKAATPTILGVAQNDPDMRTRQQAIASLGSMNDDTVIDPLRDFALNSAQTEISEAALYSLNQIQSPRAITVLTDYALSNKPLNLRRTAISSIANRPGEPSVDALFKIYEGSQDAEIRGAVIRGLSQRKSERAWTRLLEIARGSDSVPLRKVAISSIGRRGGEQAIDALINLYDSEKNEEIKDQIIGALASSRDQKVTHKLIQIAKSPQTTIERRRRIVTILAGRKDPEAIQFLEDLVKQ